MFLKILNQGNEKRKFCSLLFTEGLKAFMFIIQTKVQSQFQESALHLILNNCFLCVLCAEKTDNILRKKNQEQNKKENVFLFVPQWNKTELN